MSIKRKLTFIIMGISLAAVALTVTAITAYLIYDMRREKFSELSVTASITGDRNRAALAFLDAASVQNNLEIFRLNPSMLSACVYDAQGALFAGYQGAGGSACPQTISSIARSLPGMLTAFEPISKDSETVGNIYLVSDMRAIDAYVNKILLISGTVAAFVLGLTLMLTVYFQRTISGPLLELTSTVQSIHTSGDYTLQARTDYPNETGVLARAFNDMLNQVHARDEALLKANETLEEKVATRTHELELSKEKAEAASEAKSEFLRNMSHEFRTPLHAILSFSAYGIKEFEQAGREELKRYFEIISRGSERLSRMVNQVLDLAKLEHGEQVFALKAHDLGEITTRAQEMLRQLASDKGIALDYEIPNVIPVSCDQDKIAQVITNLLGNAVKFTSQGGRISLQAETKDSEAVITVTDEGIGIPEGELESIFESFRQSSRTNTGAGGTGLGLAICRGIVAAHGGRIWAGANPAGQGARITFTLPLLTKKAAAAITPRITEAPHENAA